MYYLIGKSMTTPRYKEGTKIRILCYKNAPKSIYHEMKVRLSYNKSIKILRPIMYTWI